MGLRPSSSQSNQGQITREIPGMIRFKQLIGLFVLGILHLGCDADQLREKRIQKARLRRQGDLNEWRILSSKKSVDCYKHCGGSRRFGGPCDACGTNGYCCSSNKLGSCSWKQSNTIKKAGMRGHRCLKPLYQTSSAPSKKPTKKSPYKSPPKKATPKKK